jgi:hypothetical protein
MLKMLAAIAAAAIVAASGTAHAGAAMTGSALLFRNQNTGELAVIAMHGTQPLDVYYPEYQLYKIAQVPTEWKIIGTGDFNNDGHGDILWRHDSGVLAIWEMAGTGVKNGYWLETTVPDLPALAEKPFVADFNGDGVSDLLWQGKRLSRPKQPGELTIDNSYDPFSSNYTYLSQTWTMAGTTAPAAIKTDSSISRWTAAVGQFDGAGGIDRFSRAFDGKTFFELSSGSILPGPSVSAAWEVKAVGDFDGDGTSDLLWHNQENGIVSVWQVQNGTYKRSVTLAYVPVAEWQVLGAADMDGDGVSEIIWRNKNGQVSVWRMSNFAVKEFGPAFMVPLEWEFAGILPTKAPLGAFQAWTYDWVKSSVQCMAQSPFQITGPKPETVVRGFGSPGVVNDASDQGYKKCRDQMAEPFVNIAGEYRMETSSLGGFNFQILPYQKIVPEYCPSGATCSRPSSTPPPTRMEQFFTATLKGQPCGLSGCPFRPFAVNTPDLIQGTLTSFTNPTNAFDPFIISIVKSQKGFSTEQCGNPSAVVPLGPGMKTTDIAAIFGTSQQQLPVQISACIAVRDTARDEFPISVGFIPR